MDNVTLKFRSVSELVDFTTTVRTMNFDISRKHLTITANFNEADVELAIEGFGAVVVEE